jgi:serine/threonine protein kinase
MPDLHGNALPKGYVFEGYRIESVLGAGGFGITYMALEGKLDRHVAIKEYMPRDLAMRETDGRSVRPISEEDKADFDYGLTRFEDEGRTLVKFRHPNIVPVLKFFDANGTAYLVMEYVEGQSLQDVLERHKTLPENELREILGPILDGLETIHEANYLHRDIKPDNIFIRAADGSPVLLDFGAARQALGSKSRTLTSIVTPGYAPFEQYSAKGKQGPWTDIYGIGATLYRAVTEARPPDAAERILDDEYVSASNSSKRQYSARFLGAIDAALALQPQDRPQNIAAWRSVLNEGASAAAQVKPDPGNHTILNAPPARKRRVKLAIPLAAAAIIVLGGVFAYVQYSSPGPESIAAQKGNPAGVISPKPAVKPANDAKRKTAEDARRKAAAEQAKADVEARRKAAEVARRKAAAAKRKTEAEARRKAAENATTKAREAAKKKAAARKAKAEAARRAKVTAARKTKTAGGRTQRATASGSAQLTAAIGGRSARYSRPDPPLEAQFVINFNAGGSVSGTRQRIDEDEIFDETPISGRWSIEGGRLCTQINLDKNAKICRSLVKRGNNYLASGGGILGSFTLVR